MRIFNKRYLFLINTLFMTSAVLAYFLFPTFKLICALFALIAFAALIVIYAVTKKRWRVMLVCSACAFAVFFGMLSSYVYFNVKMERMMKYAESDIRIKATVISQEYSKNNMSAYTVKVDHVMHNGRVDVVNFKARLECSYISEVSGGDVIYADVHAEQFKDDVNGYKMRQDMLAMGMCLSLTSDNENSYVIVDDNEHDLTVMMHDLNYKCSYALRSAIGEEEGRLASALLLGNKYLLANETVRDFSRSGVSHILALSGMHTGILMGGIAFILKKLRLPRVPRAVIMTLISVSYLALTGFSVSAVRSVLMLLCVYLSMILCYLPDTLTSLSFAGTVIILFSHGAVVDAAFWMSFAATFGIVVFMPWFADILERTAAKLSIPLVLKKALKYTVTLFATSLFALLGLIGVLCIFTREYSRYSFLASALLSLPTAVVISASAILPFIGRIPYISELAVKLIRYFASLMLDLCSDMSSLKDALIVFNYSYVTVYAVFAVICTLILLALPFKRKWVSFISVFTVVAALFVNVYVSRQMDMRDLSVVYADPSNQSDIIVISSGNDAYVFDITNGSRSSVSTAANAVRLLNHSEIEAYIMTDYSTAHISSLSWLFSSERVREVWLPYPESEDEYYTMTAILKCAQEKQVLSRVYRADDKLLFGGVNADISKGYIKRSAVPYTLIDIEYGGTHTLYTSAVYEESESDMVCDMVKNADTLIIGARGPRSKYLIRLPKDNLSSNIIIGNEQRAVYLDTSTCRGDANIYIADPYIRFLLDK